MSAPSLSIHLDIIPGLPYCSFGRPMSYPVRLARPTARLVVHECRSVLSLNKWASSVLVSHGYPGVLLARSSLSCMAGDPQAWSLGTAESFVQIKVLADFRYLGI